MSVINTAFAPHKIMTTQEYLTNHPDCVHAVKHNFDGFAMVAIWYPTNPDKRKPMRYRRKGGR